jgi:undecaprenyl-diphosphatase
VSLPDAAVAGPAVRTVDDQVVRSSMSWLEALVLGVVQGLTEFLPISSSAHQSIAGQFFGGHDPGAAFTAVTQLGTEAAVIIYFRRDIWLIIKNWALALVGRIPRDDPEARMGWLVIIGSIPIVILGLLFQDAISHALRNLWITAAMLGGFGIVIGIVDRLARNVRPLESLTWNHGIVYGLAQSLALIPGVSRSGATITAGLAMGYQRVAAAKYSFLLAIPAVVGSGLFELTKISADPVPPAWGPIALATVISFVIGYAVIAWLLRYISTHTFLPFVIYRIGLAIVVVIWLLLGVLQPLPQG